MNVLERPHTFANWLEAEFPGACDVVVDSLKDLAPKLSDDEHGSKLNMARQELLARGVQVVEGHHQRKEQRGQGAPKALSDVYGSRWLTAGAGSVLLLWGEPGDLVVECIHLKQPAEPFGPHKVIHDHVRGASSLYQPGDLLDVLEQTPGGMLVANAARAMFETATPSPNQIEKARRRLNKLADRSDLERRYDPDGSARYVARAECRVTLVTPRVTPLTDESHGSRDGSDKPHAGLTQAHAQDPVSHDPLFREGVSGSVTPGDDDIVF